METGAITSYMDVAQLTLWAFWIFFAGLLIYLRREDKREGYPVEGHLNYKGDTKLFEGFPGMPKPKTFLLPDGGTYQAPNLSRDERPVPAEPAAPFAGAPLVPTGDAMQDQIGACSYAERADVPEMTWEGEPKIVPISTLSDWKVVEGDPDPRGMDVVGADGKVAGKVTDIWLDKPESIIRYLQVDADGQTVLVPFFLTQIAGNMRRRYVQVNCVLAHQFKTAPKVKSGAQITRLEEDKIMGYFGGGHLHAKQERQEPLI